MITIRHGNLLDADAEALVNAVNTVGVMGKGIALAFKRAYPANYAAYRAACAVGAVRLGQMFVYDSGVPGRHRYVINFPTKRHWRSRSQRLRDAVLPLRRGGHDEVVVPSPD
ncbi:macro domain-containing protein [Micromonospora avicenniae]|uniref:Macro domain-containing protein n=1 Tax=Micromonospora avicenniae TaxID=1198245 RepID=A0A1N7F089_9ACTN|nr:macro domain-containing protein [Micromonospora avicenniae]SIR93803.1 Macro domain-containing protein [Micromonospora avicenniae]